MHDKISAVEISEDQFRTCQKANGQFFILNTPLLPLTNLPICISALYAKDKDSIQKRWSLQTKKASSISIPTSIAPNVWIITSPTTAIPSGITVICPGEAPRSVTPQTPIHVLQLHPACSATSQHFHLPACYESHEITINISLNTANHNVVNISAPEFRIWQHLEVSVWTLFSHAGVYVMVIGLLIPVGLGIFCCYFFWCQPARLVCWPLQSGSMWYTIADDNVEATSIYKMQWPGWRAYSKTSKESWPVYGMGTYMDRESTETTD